MDSRVSLFEGLSVSVVVTIREGQGYVSALPEGVQEKLLEATRFRAVGYQYDWRYKKGKWDGWVHLLKHSKFPAGLVSRVTGVLQAFDVEYELSTDQAAPKPGLPPMELTGVESRWYQDEAVEAALLNPRGVIRAPTGSGKTAIGARVIVARGKHALVIVPTIDLLYQYRAFLEEHLVMLPDDAAHGFGRPPIGQLGDGVVDPQPITVATVRTAAKALEVAFESYEYGEYDDKDDTEVKPSELREWVQRLGLVIVDEAHILGAQTVFDVCTKIPAPNKIGMSASPWRDDGADLMIEAATGPVIYRIGTDILVRDGFLVPPVIRVIDTSSWWDAGAWGQTCARCGTTRAKDARGPVRICPNCGSQRWRSEFTDAYREEIVENAIRNRRIADEVIGLGVPTLVLVKQVKHGRILRDLIPDAHFLSGKDSGTERAEVFEQMRRGNLMVLIATTIADMGLDLPILRALVLAGGGKSSTRHLQRIGRVARPYPGKDTALVLDLDDGHVHKWFREHAKARRKIEKAEWAATAIWI